MLLDILSMQRAGCPVGRHELTNHQWILLGDIREEIARMQYEQAEKNRRRK